MPFTRAKGDGHEGLRPLEAIPGEAWWKLQDNGKWGAPRGRRAELVTPRKEDPMTTCTIETRGTTNG